MTSSPLERKSRNFTFLSTEERARWTCDENQLASVKYRQSHHGASLQESLIVRTLPCPFRIEASNPWREGPPARRKAVSPDQAGGTVQIMSVKVNVGSFEPSVRELPEGGYDYAESDFADLGVRLPVTGRFWRGKPACSTRMVGDGLRRSRSAVGALRGSRIQRFWRKQLLIFRPQMRTQNVKFAGKISLRRRKSASSSARRILRLPAPRTSASASVWRRPVPGLPSARSSR